MKYWREAAELPGLVSLSLQKTIKTHPAVGWVRATSVALPELLLELNTLRKENEGLRSKVQSSGQQPQEVVENIAGMDEAITLYGTYRRDSRDTTSKWQQALTWNQIFAIISPHLLKNPNDELVQIYLTKYLLENQNVTGTFNSNINEQVFHTVKIQLMAYGLVKVHYARSTTDSMELFWSITDKGLRLMTQLRTVKKKV